MTRRVLASVLALIVFSAQARRCLGAQDPVQPAAVGPSSELDLPPIADVKPEDFVYVAATRIDRIGRVMAPVFVNGLGPFAFVVDTGASSSVISPRVVARLKVAPDATHMKLLRGITGSEVVSTVPVEEVTVGEITLRHRQLPAVESRVFADADGIIGADAFAGGCLYVDFQNSRVSILRTACPRVDERWKTMRAHLRFDGLLVVDGTIGRGRVSAIIDTGAERSLGNPALLSAAGLRKAEQNPGVRTQVFAATSQAVYGSLLPTPPVRLGDVRIGDLDVVFADFEVFHMWGVENQPAIVIGMDVLGTTQAMMIDYKRQQLRLLGRGEKNNVRLPKRPSDANR